MESGSQGYAPKDLASFQDYFDLPRQNVSRDIGGHDTNAPCFNDPDSCSEASIDAQYLMAVAQGGVTWFWHTGDATFAAWLAEVAAVEDPPLVHSISYHVQEDQIPVNTRVQLAVESQKLGLRGVTIAVSTGDNGVSNVAGEAQADCAYGSSWPASSPFVVTVGATQGHNYIRP